MSSIELNVGAVSAQGRSTDVSQAAKALDKAANSFVESLASSLNKVDKMDKPMQKIFSMDLGCMKQLKSIVSFDGAVNKVSSDEGAAKEFSKRINEAAEVVNGRKYPELKKGLDDTAFLAKWYAQNITERQRLTQFASSLNETSKILEDTLSGA